MPATPPNIAANLHQFTYWLIIGLFVAMLGCSTKTEIKEPTSQQKADPSANQTGANFTPLPLYHQDSQITRANYQAESVRDPNAFPEATEQEIAAQALGRIGKPAVPMLMNALQHRDPHVRKQAAQVLAKIGPEANQAVPLLVAVLDDADPAVRRAATRALGQIGPAAQEAVPALMRSLVQPEAPARN
jgi:HEAT repeat protein